MNLNRIIDMVVRLLVLRAVNWTIGRAAGYISRSRSRTDSRTAGGADAGPLRRRGPDPGPDPGARPAPSGPALPVPGTDRKRVRQALRIMRRLGR